MSSKTKKEQIADAFVKMIAETNLESIRVQDIAERAGVSKATFYRLFRDKYDVMNWIYIGPVEPLVQADPDLAKWKEWTRNNQTHLRENRQYFRNILSYTGQNSFEASLAAYFLNNIRRSVKMKLNGAAIPPDLVFAMEAMSRVNAFAVVRWISSNCDQPVEEMIGQVEKCIPDILKPFYGIEEKKDGAEAK